MSNIDTEKNYRVPYELFPTDAFELPAVLQKLRDLRDSAVGAEVAAKMDQATAELAAAEPLAGMPSVGDTAPKFELVNQTGIMVSLDDLLTAGPVVVIFYRGVWCPFCSLTLRAYEQHLPELRAMGSSLVGISLQTPDDSLTTAERNALTYQVLSDVGATVSRRYGLIFALPEFLQDTYRKLGHPLPAFNGTADWELPIPASFVIDRDGIVRFADAMADYTHRTDPAEVMAAVRELASS
ncbi:peroxiredoxin-like family protein [Mycobacterium sp. 1245852.3]|uniref:peroxiredoxin-like family protein n=1 Tax=Mycobacterium sp. 1245852.3 TaxID=1856860 RepID=UPI0009ECE25C|nr:peroxiredoxin-like family protein [Mycobacterium sp. 1245852.3]